MGYKCSVKAHILIKWDNKVAVRGLDTLVHCRCITFVIRILYVNEIAIIRLYPLQGIVDRLIIYDDNLDWPIVLRHYMF
jgi:hypothetical protein